MGVGEGGGVNSLAHIYYRVGTFSDNGDKGTGLKQVSIHQGTDSDGRATQPRGTDVPDCLSCSQPFRIVGFNFKCHSPPLAPKQVKP